MNTTTGIAVALAVAVAMIFLFFGPTFFNLFSTNQDLTMPLENNSQPTLLISDAVVGTGAEAKAGDTISVNYVGRFEDGSVFDASANHGGPFSFVLGAGAVIPGWDQGVVGMKEGGRRVLSVPPELGYGMNDYGPIPGGSTLIFEIELVDVAN
ncbi:FKBP-type peptidyl-prolyl cis-trans isomerase [Patescibacteria group bacterium]|nr:FKBP-type peptidyl-prolyl cis-trans isomerase [Patescibacteria group bacterium]